MKNTQSKEIRKHLRTFFMTRKSFTTTTLMSYMYVKLKTAYVMPDTIMRYMRDMRTKKLLDYDCRVKKDMFYLITKKPI